MIVQEIIEQPDGGWTLVRTYSDAGMQIRQDETGWLYSEAIDPQFTGRTYTETDIPIDADEEESEEETEPMVASKNIERGQYFSVGDNLYLSTSTIAAGEEIVVGGNCQAAALADVLNDLSKEE